jgi:hypothetical protein
MKSVATGARRGFALMAVLWTLTSAAALAMLALLTARDAVGTARNRTSLIRASWRAEGCAERVRAKVDDALSHESDPVVIWRSLDSVVLSQAVAVGCDLTFRPAGTTLDVNTISAPAVSALTRMLGATEIEADSLADALADWRDPDDTPRANGAERETYLALGRVPPRNGDLASSRELKLVLGFDRFPGIDTLLSVGAPRVWLARAPTSILGALPGLGPDAARQFETIRLGSGAAPDLATLASLLSPDESRLLTSHMPELAVMVTTDPDVWTVSSVASSGSPPIRASLELRLARTGRRAAIVDRVSWP